MEGALTVPSEPQTRDPASGNPDPALIVRFSTPRIAFPLTDPGQSSTFLLSSNVQRRAPCRAAGRAAG